MATVGILGRNSEETANAFLLICQEKGLNTPEKSYRIIQNNEVFVSVTKNTNDIPQIWVIQEGTDSGLTLPYHSGKDGYWVINADNYPISPPHDQWDIITYGFNGKASVTASSVADGILQVCVQRGFMTLGKHFYEPQEFKAPCPFSINPLNVLGAAVACALCDVLIN